MIRKIIVTICLIALICCVSASAVEVTNVTINRSGEPCLLANGNPVVLQNYADAKNPTWDVLRVALKADKTDEHIYRHRTYKCTNYARDLHNSLEKNYHIKTAVVVIMYNATNGHALNAIQTTDQGLVYIDQSGCEGTKGADMRAIIKLRKSYTVMGIFVRGINWAQWAPQTSEIYW
jgi:hypothetical protein